MPIAKLKLDSRTTAFVDVDTQVDFVEPTGALYVSGAEALKPRWAALLKAAQQHGYPVIASADAHSVDDREFEQFPPHCVVGSAGQASIPETRPPSGALLIPPSGTGPTEGFAHITLQKVTFDLFSNRAADKVLAGLGVRRAVVFGLALDYCVKAAAIGLSERGIETFLVTDATLPVTAEGGQLALAELADAGVHLCTTEEVLSTVAPKAPERNVRP